LPDSRVHYTTLAALSHYASESGAPALLLVGPQFHARAANLIEDRPTQFAEAVASN